MEENTNERSVAGQTEAPAEQTAPAETPQTADAEAPQTAEKTGGVSGGLRRALIRCGAALLVAIALLALTHFSIFAVIKGPTETTSLESEQAGAFVKRDIYAIVGYSQDETSGSAVVGEYAVVPMDGKFVTVHLPKRYLSASDTVYQETKNYIDGNTTTLDSFFVVDGTVSKLTDEQKTSLSDWYAANKDYLVQTHVIDENAAETDYLSDTILEVDRYNGMSQIFIIVLSCIAGLCLCYVVAELILMACGYYLDSRIKRRLALANSVFAGATAEEILVRVQNGEPEDPESGTAGAADGGEDAPAPADGASPDESAETPPTPEGDAPAPEDRA